MEKTKPSDLGKQAEQLLAQGKMPTLAQLLKAVQETRTKYAPLISAAREAK